MRTDPYLPVHDLPKTDDRGRRLRHGGCVCGRVRFTVAGEPTRVGLCHCRLCRKFTGSAYLFFADWPRDAFEATGEAATYDGRSFCPTCGSRLFHLSEAEAEIEVGALDEVPSGLVPDVECWTTRREDWLSPLPSVRQATEDP